MDEPTSAGELLRTVLKRAQERQPEEASGPLATYAAEVRGAFARIDADAKREPTAAELSDQLVSRGIPRRFAEALVQGEPGDTQALTRSRQFLADTQARSLLLSGPPGCGKTFAACWILTQRCPDRASRWQAPARFVSVSKLARIDRYSDEIMQPLERATMLVIDDLGTEYVDTKGSFLATLDGLFDARYAEGLRTVITTNLTAAQFRERYGERICDRIRETGAMCELAETSLRRRGQ